jgi:hypothetical protein
MRLIEVFLFEAICPLCGDTDAYEGFRDVECTTKGCENFSQKQYDEVNKSSGGMYEMTVQQCDYLVIDMTNYRYDVINPSTSNKENFEVALAVQYAIERDPTYESQINSPDIATIKTKIKFSKEQVELIKKVLEHYIKENPMPGGRGEKIRKELLNTVFNK